MALSDVNDPEFILKAIGESDRLGRLRFLTKYGYRAARRLVLLVNGKEYDSKAIVGVAHKYARPKEGPLKASTFSGGIRTAVARLESLGFEVVDKGANIPDEVLVEEAIALVLVENEVTYDSRHDGWEDMTGSQYHFPNKYKNLVVPGRPFVYYQGVRRENGRGPAAYFGVGRIGRKWPSPQNATEKNKRKWKWYCEIEDYVPFGLPVSPTTSKGPRFELITNPRDWGVGVRALPLESFDAILKEAKTGLSGADAPLSSEDLVDALLLPPVESVDVSSPAVAQPLLRPTKIKTNGVQGKSGGSSSRRSKHAKLVGDRAEEVAVRWLKMHLSPAEAETVDWVARKGLKPGWDIVYTASNGKQVAVEVKGCTAATMTTLEVTANEWRAAAERRSQYHLLIVAKCLSLKPLFEPIVDPYGLVESKAFSATPASWEIVRRTSDS